MRKRIGWMALLVMLGVAVTPQASRAQGVGDLSPVPPPTIGIPWPFGGQHLELGGPYFAGEFVYWRQTNPIKPETLAVRGFVDQDGSVGSAIGLGNTPGQFIGSRASALDANSVSGPNNYDPGFAVTLGYRFESGLAVEMKWVHLTDVRYNATAGVLPNSPIGGSAQETFITSPVYNFPPAYSGPGNTFTNAAGAPIGNPIALLGIWDGSSLQTIQFVQRFDQWEMTFREPIQETETWRTYGLLGPRLVSMWERFTWITVHPEADGSVLPIDTVNYTNVTSNRLYGVHAGIGNDWQICDTPCGAFSIGLDIDAAFFIDFVKGRPKYELGDESTATQRGRNLVSFVPEFDGQLYLSWYPYHGIECRFGYNGMVFFNTIASPKPVDFNFGAIAPAYSSTLRTFDGFNLGVGFTF